MNDTTTKHTPLTVGRTHGSKWDDCICDGPVVVARVTGGGYPIGKGWSPASEAMRDRIVTAVNAHDDLLACLKDAQARGQVAAATYRHLAKVQDEKTNLGLAKEWQRFADFWAAAIAKAEGRS